MLRCDSASFLEFVGTRVSQVKALSSPEKEWFWIPTDCNLADLGTRPNMEPGDLQEGSDYQDGMAWMRLPEAEWPTRQHFSPPPQEERRKDVVTVAGAFHARRQGGLQDQEQMLQVQIALEAIAAARGGAHA
jgi:hypothetical protein